MYDPTKPYIKNIHDIIRETWQTPLCLVEESYPYALINVLTNARQVDHTDGIGTKGFYHWKERTFAAAAQDAYAMNFNDLLMVGSKPVKCQNHISLPEDDHKAIVDIVSALADLCKSTNVVLTGGETSIHDNIIGMDLSVSMTGVVSKKFNNKFTIGSTIIGYPSSGLHSNGFTKLSEQIRKGKMPYSFDVTTPTQLYHKQIWDVGYDKLNGICHITGGAFTKLIGLLPIDADIELIMPKSYPEIFDILSKSGISCEDMYRNFNCGWGMLIATSCPEYVQEISRGTILGKVVDGGSRIKIKSAFTEEEVVY